MQPVDLLIVVYMFTGLKIPAKEAKHGYIPTRVSGENYAFSFELLGLRLWKSIIIIDLRHHFVLHLGNKHIATEPKSLAAKWDKGHWQIEMSACS